MLVVVVFAVLAWPGGNDCCGYCAAATTAAASTSSTATERNVFRLPKVAAEDDPKAAPFETPDLAVPRQSPSPLVMKNVPQLLAASQPLREAVTVNGIYAHLEQFQAIADAQTPHVRSSGTAGARASVQYIVSQLVQAGYQRDVDIQLQEFPVSRDEQGVNIICNLDPQTANDENNAARDDKRKVVIVGAHVDSVPEGPGINDNGSGAATVLELAIQMRRQLLLRQQQQQQSNSMLRPTTPITTSSNTIMRFIWFGAEEVGLVGAQYYVDQVLLRTENAKEKISSTIQAMLNFDMLASPNYARFVYDGDGSDHPDSGPGPDGSHIIERVFLDYFDHTGLAAEAVPLGAFSDYFPFAVESVPVGGVFSGHSWKKTRAQVSKFGGIAGRAFDFCYHAACDDLDNINVQALQELSQAAAHGVWTFYQSGNSLLSLSSSSSAASDNDGVVVQATNNNNANDSAVMEPTGSPITTAPSQSPTSAPSQSPTVAPSQSPTLKPSTNSPTTQPPISDNNTSSSPTVLSVVTSNSLMTTTNTMDDSSSSSPKETPSSSPLSSSASAAAAAASHAVQTHDESPSSHGDSSSSHSHDGSTRARVLAWGLNVLLAVWLVAVALGCY